MLEVSENDALETCEHFLCNSKFIKKEEYNKEHDNINEGGEFVYRIGDDNIKLEMETNINYQNALIKIIIDAYYNNAIKPESIKEDTKDIVIKESNDDIIKRYFIFTNDNKDRIPMTEIHNKLNFIKPMQLKSLLLSLGAGTIKNNIRYYTKIKYDFKE